MQAHHVTVLNTLTRVQQFLDSNSATLGAINKSGTRKNLDDAVRTLGAHGVKQTTSKRVGAAQTAKQIVLRCKLKVNHMRPIAAVAAAQLTQAPELLALRMPGNNVTSRRLVATAGAMAVEASTYAKTFTDAGLPADFVAQLVRAADALNAAISNRGATQSRQSGATAGMAAEATRGRQMVKVLDALVVPKLAGNISLLAEWKTAKRFLGKTSRVANTTIDAASGAISITPPDGVASTTNDEARAMTPTP